MLKRIRPSGPAARARRELAADFIADLRRLDAQIRQTRNKLAATVQASGTTLTEIFGADPVIAAAVLGTAGDPSRFGDRDRFAACNGPPDRGLLRRPEDPPAVAARQPAPQPRHPRPAPHGSADRPAIQRYPRGHRVQDRAGRVALKMGFTGHRPGLEQGSVRPALCPLAAGQAVGTAGRKPRRRRAVSAVVPAARFAGVPRTRPPTQESRQLSCRCAFALCRPAGLVSPARKVPIEWIAALPRQACCCSHRDRGHDYRPQGAPICCHACRRG